jgi:RNA polymerase sigma factor (sigma-70 family)
LSSHPGFLARHLHDGTKIEDVTVTDEKFEEARPHLRAVAYRMLGSLAEADDAVQEAWLRLARTDAAEVENLRGWLTTVVGRVCLDMLRARKARREESADETALEKHPARERGAEEEAVLADSMSMALLVVLETLEPAERLAFVLHDLFGVSFEEIAPIVGRTEVAARPRASRARRRIRGAPEAHQAELARRADVVRTLLAALRAGDVDAVVAALDPDVVVHAAGPDGNVREIHGARNWAKTAVVFSRVRGVDVSIALVDDALGAVYAPDGRVSSALVFGFTGDAITRVDIIADAARVKDLDIAAID